MVEYWLYTHVEPREDRREGSETWRRPRPEMTGIEKNYNYYEMFLHIKSWNTENSIEARFEFELTKVVSTH